ncbi:MULTISPECIES: hypothetical protein [Niastella]|uniref:GLPGLI family protein n=1 Tax=Niastella soli TaxID=2821487 RepID=A0ABS3YZN7_9BACT|nr:hypothetical protein [Niastella soli]MBO9203399.1 hypothetical protein [Niastella soli]
MKRSPLLLALFIGQVALAQIGTRSVASKPAKPAYDSSININSIECEFEPASLIGQEIHFLPRTPYAKKAEWDEPSWPLFLSEKNQKAYKGTSKGYTPFSALENKTFKIVNWEVTDEEYCTRTITLEDESGERIRWQFGDRWQLNVAAFFNGYLEKLKQTYVNKNIFFSIDPNDIPAEYENPLDKQTREFVPGSKWRCTEITFLEEEKKYFGQLALILKDSANKEIAVRITYDKFIDPEDKCLNQSNIITEDKYLARKKEEKRVRDSLIAKEKARNLQYEKEFKANKARLIKVFGPTNGNLIADGVVKSGMTKDMCREAWGSADKIYTTTTAGTLYETWFYGFSRWLRFRNGKLYSFME